MLLFKATPPLILCNSVLKIRITFRYVKKNVLLLFFNEILRNCKRTLGTHRRLTA